MALKAVLFDHDGTLVDSEGIHCRHWQQVLEHYGVNLTENEYKLHYSGIPTATNAIRLAERYGLDVSPAMLAQQKNQTTQNYLAAQPFPLMPHVLKTVQFFHNQGMILAIVTGAGIDGVNTTMTAYGLSPYFSLVVTGDQVKHSKPAPDCYLLALEKLGLAPQECIALEDTEHGSRAAVSAGVACCAIKNAFSETHDFSFATRLFDDLGEAAKWISSTYGLDEPGASYAMHE